jgi:hypothetical protein
VTLSSWQDIWLNEGFASYLSILWREKIQGIEFTNGTIASFYETMSQNEPFRKMSRQEFTEHYLALIAQDKFFSNGDIKTDLKFVVRSNLKGDDLDGFLSFIPVEGLDAEGIGNLILELEADDLELPSSSLAGFFGALGKDDLARSFYEEYPASGDPTADKLFNQTMYLRGAIVLHALRIEIGEQAFFNVLRVYYEQHAYGNASTEDFISVAVDISEQNLQSFFDAWLYNAKMPDIPELGLFNGDFELSNIFID